MSEAQNIRRSALVCSALVLVTAAVYWPAHGFDYIAYDDPGYVGANPHIRTGFTVAGIVWAFREFVGDTFYWMPMSWLSHMLDCQLFGVDAGAHHLMNVGYHAANAVLVFLLLRQLTGAFWRSAAVAALFAWHPLQVDSVAWVAERKNLLCAFFLLLTLMAYVRYVRKPAPAQYVVVFLLLCLAAMAKPTAVIAPGLMLVLDFWPLGRVQSLKSKVQSPEAEVPSSKFPVSSSTSEHETTRPPSGIISRFTFHVSRITHHAPRSTGWLLLEKVPLLIPVAVSSGAIVITHHFYNALASLKDLPVSARVANAFVSYLRYVGKTVWPTHLAIFYPLPKTWPVWLVLLAIAFVLAVSVLAVRSAAARPWFLAGWLWFLGGLFPNIGLVQAATQAMGDRFAYLPLIGLFVMGVWGLAECSARWRYRMPVRAAAATLCLLALLTVTGFQLQHWRNTIAVFQHAAEVTEKNTLAHDLLAVTFAYQGKAEEAIAHCKALLAIDPNSAAAERTVGVVLRTQGDVAGAISHFLRALEVEPEAAFIRYDLAQALSQQGQTAEAIRQYQEVIRQQANHRGWTPYAGTSASGTQLKARACGELAWVLATAEDPKYRDADQAIEMARRAVALTAENTPEPWLTLATVCAAAHRTNDAVQAVQKAVALQAPASHLAANRQLPRALADLGLSLVPDGQIGAAMVLLSEAARLASDTMDRAEIERQIGIVFSEKGKFEEAAAHYQRALQIYPRFATAHFDLALDLAHQGKSAGALEHYAKAIEINPFYAEAHRNLALALLSAGQSADARAHLADAIRLKPDYVDALNDLAWMLATASDARLREGKEALRLAKHAAELTGHKDAGILETLAAAYAETGQFPEAIKTAEQAIGLCDPASQKELLTTLQNCLKLFRAGQPLQH